MEVHANWFLEWFNSPYYHQLYAEHDHQEAVSFIDRLLELLVPALGSKMVDIACGRGRHARILASKGFDVTGIDLAPENIAYAGRFDSGNLHFYVHDMRLPFMINYFDFAFNFFTSFGYFRSDREHYAAVRTISRCLKRSGLLVVDYLNSAYVEDHFIPRSEKQVEAVTFYMTRWFD